MIRPRLLHALGWFWVVFGTYWIIAGRRRKPDQTTEWRFYRFFRLLVLALTFTLLFSNWTALGPLRRSFLTPDSFIPYVGFMVTLAGMALALWARTHLGEYWSDKVVLKVGHQLIRSGPYAHMRHPIYSGVLLAVAGSALVLGEWRGVVAFLILLANYAIKAGREDRILAASFADRFADHKRHAGFLLPRWRGRS
jgi:protein-S-isoprenylcysteine O-methyltransferase Ste14